MQKKVLITGANAGIGLALAKKFLAEGFFVIGTSRSGTINAIQSDDLLVVSLDVTSDKSITQATAMLNNFVDGIDLLINNAGIGKKLDENSAEINLMKETFGTNVFGLVSFTEAILGKINDGGTIFNISSRMGMLNREALLANAPAYRMSKAALNMYTKTLAARLQNKDMNVNSIHPGWVKTNMGGEEADITPEFSANGIYNLYLKKIPTGTFWNAEDEQQMNW